MEKPFACSMAGQGELYVFLEKFMCLRIKGGCEKMRNHFFTALFLQKQFLTILYIYSIDSMYFV